MSLGSVLGDELHERLARAARNLGKTRTYIVREAVRQWLANYDTEQRLLAYKEHEKDFGVEEQFGAELTTLATSWMELGIDPDDFLKCALCHEFFVDGPPDFGPREHCKETVYIIKTANNLLHAKVLPGEGGLEAADKEAKRIRGKLFGISVDGKEIRLAFYDGASSR
jgi:Ribbon-helix-helix protein, copG family